MLRDREDLSAQRARIEDARAELADALTRADDEASDASRALARRKKGRPDLGPFFASVEVVKRADEALDIALYDLRTASGEDG